ncbi:hypothetical protein ACQPZJ_44810 [Actinoplanes sp. CA-054009]
MSSSAVTEIHMCDQVRQLLGPDLLEKVTPAALANGRCQDCKQRLPATGVVNVVVFRDKDSCVVGFVHPHCGTSQIRPLPARTLTTTCPAAVPMQLSAFLQRHGGRELPVIAIQPAMQALIVDSDTKAELADAFLAALVNAGMTAEVSFVRAPEPLLGWPITITTVGPDKAAIQIRMPNGALLCDGVTAMPPGWRAAASRHSWCVLYAGRGCWCLQAGALEGGQLTGPVGETVGTRLRLFGCRP